MSSDSAVYRAVCTCGKVVAEREARESNLPAENNRRIAEQCAGVHKFTHTWRDEVAVVGVVVDGDD